MRNRAEKLLTIKIKKFTNVNHNNNNKIKIYIYISTFYFLFFIFLWLKIGHFELRAVLTQNLYSAESHM